MRTAHGLWLSSALAALLLAAAPAAAHHVQGKIYCDVDGGGTINAGDTPVDGVVVKSTSQIASPGSMLTDTSGDSVPSNFPGPGAWYIKLPGAVTDDYLVELVPASLPAGSSIVFPPGGTYLAHIITGSSVTDHVDGLDFLLTGCTPPTTTTSSTTTSTRPSSTTSTTTTSTTSSTTTTESTTTTSSTTTTTTTTTSTTTTSTTTTTTSTTSTTSPLTTCEELLDHFKCYHLRLDGGFPPTPVTLSDQFAEALDGLLLRPLRFCNPADKAGEGIIDPTAHLACYQLHDQANFQRRRVTVQNQFGEQRLSVVREESLCVPAKKNGVDSPLSLDRFKCYRVYQRHRHDFTPRDVSLTDQFETTTTSVLRPYLLCNPADLEGSPVEVMNPACHLTCYKIRDGVQSSFTPRDVSIEDEFSDESVTAIRGDCRQSSLLCVPSLKFEE